MSTVARLTLFAAVMLVVFGLGFLGGREFIPESTVTEWTDEAKVGKEHDPMKDAAR